MADGAALQTGGTNVRWAKVIDHTRCIGCHACSTACKSEHQIPLGVQRTYVKYVDVGRFPAVRRAFQVTRCNQCERPPCVAICPTASMYRRADGIVDFDKSACIGCKACMAACPYDAIFVNPEDGSAEKCNVCAHRLEIGLEPACAVVCPTGAIIVGDVNEPASPVAQLIAREALSVRRPETGTRPALFYRGAHHATLDPLGARRPAGGLFLWSEQGNVPHQVACGHPGGEEGIAIDAVLAYDVPHRVPWDWRVALYAWAKAIAAGAYLVPAVLAAGGWLPPASALWSWIGPSIGGMFLAVTALALLADLEHPRRFYLIFTRPQWRSWLVRGTAVIVAYGALLVLHLASSIAGVAGVPAALSWPGVPLAAAAAGYTAYLFAQARGRDQWHSRILPARMLLQAVLAGAAALLIVAPWAEPAAMPVLARVTAGACLLQALAAIADASSTRATPRARLAAREMTRGRLAAWFWTGAALTAAGALTVWLGPAGGALALVGLLASEHAFIQAGQSVPLA